MERLASPGRTSPRYFRMGMLSCRQLSTIEKMAAILARQLLIPVGKGGIAMISTFLYA